MPRVGKVPRVDPEAQPTPATRRPVWALRSMDLTGPFAWQGLDEECLLRIRERLANLETMTWQEIEQGARSHFVEVGDLEKSARNRLTAIRQDDLDYLFSIRVDGKERIWGIRDNEILRILWWDPNHAVCPSKKKHT